MTLDELLAAIDPAHTEMEIERLSDEALNSFHIPGATVADWSEFQSCMARFVQHVLGVLLGLHERMPKHDAMHFGKACRLLMQEFGPDGEHAAAKMAIHGVEGGLYRVLKVSAARLAREHSENAVAAEVAAFWNGRSPKEKLAVAQEYVARYGHLLPADVTAGGAPRVLAFLPRFLQNHSKLNRRLRDVNRRMGA